MNTPKRLKMMLAGFLSLALVALCAADSPAETRLRLATTTSTENSGLLYRLLPPFEKQQGVKVGVIAVGTGKALKLGMRCDADLVLVHALALEKKFVAQGHGLKRVPLMHNFFIIIGPAGDPAGVARAKSAPAAFAAIAKAKARFISRGDNSGTYVKEMHLWKTAGLKPTWPGYREAGRGMGAVLTMASEMKAYTLTDSGTYFKYLSLGKLSSKMLFAGDAHLKNPYAVMVVNPALCPKAKAKLAQALVDYLVSKPAQALVGAYRASGKQLFWPDAHPVK